MNSSQTIKRVDRLGDRHPRQVARLRVAIGVWLLCVMTFLYASGHGGQWAWLLAVGTAVHFIWAYRLFQVARDDSPRRVSMPDRGTTDARAE